MFLLQLRDLAAYPGDDAAPRDADGSRGQAQEYSDLFDRLLFDAGQPKGTPGRFLHRAFHSRGHPMEQLAAMLDEQLLRDVGRIRLRSIA
jgi:hypothetical protein